MNQLFAEELIINRLLDTPALMAVVNSVDSMTDFDSVLQRSQFGPALFVSYAGERIAATYDDGKVQTVQQRWGVVVLVSTAQGMLAGRTAREMAGDILYEVGKALAGYRLNDTVSSLEQIDSPAPIYKNKFAYFFMMFGLNMARTYS